MGGSRSQIHGGQIFTKAFWRCLKNLKMNNIPNLWSKNISSPVWPRYTFLGGGGHAVKVWNFLVIVIIVNNNYRYLKFVEAREDDKNLFINIKTQIQAHWIRQCMEVYANMLIIYCDCQPYVCTHTLYMYSKKMWNFIPKKIILPEKWWFYSGNGKFICPFCSDIHAGKLFS